MWSWVFGYIDRGKNYVMDQNIGLELQLFAGTKYFQMGVCSASKYCTH